MFTQFRKYYPQGSLISELVTIAHGKYVVRTLVQIDGVTLASGLAAAETVEQAEDRSRDRALAILDLHSRSKSITNIQGATVVNPRVDRSPENSGNKPPQTTTLHEHKSNSVQQSQPTLNDHDSNSVQQSEPTLNDHDSNSVQQSQPTLNDHDSNSVEQSQPTLNDHDSNYYEENYFFDEEFSSESSETVAREEKQSQSPLAEEEIHLDESEVTSESTNEPELNSREPMDFSEVLAKTDVELKRLGWTKEKGRDYLLQTYGKKSRHYLSDDELLEFLNFLTSQPNP